MKTIIFGIGGLAKILYDKLPAAGYEISAFCLEQNYIKSLFFQDLPIIPFEDIEITYPNTRYNFIIGIGGNQLNRLRTRIYHSFLEKGYTPLSYIDKSASIAPNVSIGKHCVFLENVVAHTDVKIGDNVIVFPNTYLGHHTVIGDNCFIAANVTIAGGAKIKNNCFLGASSSIANSITLEEDNVLAMGSFCTKSTQKNQLIINNKCIDDAYTHFNNYFTKASSNFNR